MEPDKFNIEPWSQRSPIDRRTQTEDRRNQVSTFASTFCGLDKRITTDRREENERRDGWLRIGRWRSVSVFGS